MAKRLDGSISKPLERGERGGDMKIRAQLLVVAAFVLGLAATAAAQPGTVFLQGRGGSLIPVGPFHHQQNPGRMFEPRKA